MTRVLLVTVGGTPQPILEAVRAHQPDEVVFICSAPPCPAPSTLQVIGDGTPCRHRLDDGSEEERANLVTQLALQGFREDLQIVPLPSPDDLGDCHRRIRHACQTLEGRFSRCELIGDHSGGTKTMIAALVLALLEREADLSVVSGERSDLVRISGSSEARPIAIGELQALRLVQERLPSFLLDHRYDRCVEALKDFLCQYGDELDDERYAAGQRFAGALQCCVNWDRFRPRDALVHGKATGLAAAFPELINWWERIDAARRWLLEGIQPTIAVTGYELVEDLVLNAERRGRRGWYDDAVARLYRALELLAQTYIQLELGIHHRSFWNDPDIQRDQTRLRLSRGLMGLLRWLQNREGGTGLGNKVNRQWPELRRLIDSRNNSLLGHGLTPVQESAWQSLQARIGRLVDTTMQDLGIQPGAAPHQLPATALLQLPDALAVAAMMR